MSLAVDERADHATASSTSEAAGRLIAVTADLDVDRALRDVWAERYLRIAPDGDWTARLARAGTDALLLDPRAPGVGRLRFRDISAASTIYVLQRRSRGVGPGGIARIRRDVARGRLRPCGGHLLSDAVGGLSVDAFEVVQRRPVSARRWYPADEGPGGFIDRLRAAGVRFVVLRWYDELPQLPPGEDLDLLVADADVPIVERVLAERPGTEPCDLYSVSGLPGTDFHAMAYLPPALAHRLVVRGELLRGRFPVPNPHDALVALGYHVAYHKGLASGVPLTRDAAPTVNNADHDYVDVLSRMGEPLGVGPLRSLTELDEWLTEQGVRPSRDTLNRLAGINPLAGTLAAAARGNAPDGLAVFFIRERAVHRGEADAIVAQIEGEGFTVLARSDLDGAARRRVSRLVRGGNWERGPYPISGGPPAVMVVAVDVMPADVDQRMRAAWPALDNARLLVKHRIRDGYNGGRPPAEHCNVLHSSDNADEAADYLGAALPRSSEKLLEQARTIVHRYRSTSNVVRDLSRHARRARVELIDDGSTLLVRKQFRPGCERFAARERYVAGELAPGCDELVRMVSADDDSVTYPYYDNVLRFDRRKPRLLPLSVVRSAMSAAEYLYDNGVALIDFTPVNVIVTPAGRVHVIDYEFAHRYDEVPASFEQSYDIAGPPDGFAGDLPFDAYGLGYRDAWQPYVGLTWAQLRRSPRWLQHLHRGRHRVAVTWPRLVGDWAGLTKRRIVRRLHRLDVRIRRLAALFSHG
jgi:hypothetical protein